MQVLKDQCGNLVDIDFGFVIFGACLRTGLPSTFSLAGLTLTPDDIADARLAVTLAHLFAFAIVVAKLVFIERAHRHSDGAFAVGKDDGFIRNDRAEIFTNGLFDALFMAVLIDDALALQ